MELDKYVTIFDNRGQIIGYVPKATPDDMKPKQTPAVAVIEEKSKQSSKKSGKNKKRSNSPSSSNRSTDDNKKHHKYEKVNTPPKIYDMDIVSIIRLLDEADNANRKARKAIQKLNRRLA